MQHTAHSFRSTSWSDVVRAGGGASTDQRAALESLLTVYWPPLYAFLRRDGHGAAEAEDLVQGFVLHVMESGTLARASEERGRFRSFLLGALKRYVAQRHRHDTAQKRSPGTALLQIDAPAVEAALDAEGAGNADTAFERAWVSQVLRRATERVRQAYTQDGRGELFDVLSPFMTGQSGETIAGAAARQRMSEGAMGMALHRLRCRFGEAVREEVAALVATPDEVDDEVRLLLAALGKK